MTRTVVLNVVGLTPGIVERRTAAGAMGGRRGAGAHPAGVSRRDLHGAVQLPDRPLSDHARHRRQRLVRARGCGDQVLEAVEPARAGAKDLGAGARARPARSRAPTCSGGTTCIRPRTTASRRGRCIPPTAASFRTSTPTPANLRDELQRALGTFPLFNFWGPRAVDRVHDVDCRIGQARRAEVLADAVARLPCRISTTTCSALAQAIPAAASDVRQVDAVCGDLIRLLRGPRRTGRDPFRVRARATSTTPVHINRVLRQQGLIAVRDELGLELLDPGASAAFAVADHQVAHVYVNDPSKLHQVRTLLERHAGHRTGARRRRARPRTDIDHPRAGDLVAISAPERRGSPTTTGSTTSGRRTSRGRSTSIASPATIPSSCSSIRRFACRRSPSAGSWRRRRLDSAC